MLEYDKKKQTYSITADFHSKSSELRQGTVSIYTDGSKEPGEAVGAGIYSLDLGISIGHKLPGVTSIFPAEF